MAPERDPPPSMSKARLAGVSFAALLGATTLVLGAVLPAEYGIDPLGTGEALGLLALSGIVVAAAPVPASGSTESAPIQEGPVGHYSAEYKVDTIEFVLDAYEYVEYKYRLAQGATMLFSWTTTPLYSMTSMASPHRSARWCHILRQAEPKRCQRQLHSTIHRYPRLVLGKSRRGAHNCEGDNCRVLHVGPGIPFQRYSRPS